MPVVPTETNAQAFRRNFLEAGGLKYMLQSKVIPRHFDLSVRQDCYAMMLSLSRCECVHVQVYMKVCMCGSAVRVGVSVCTCMHTCGINELLHNLQVSAVQ